MNHKHANFVNRTVPDAALGVHFPVILRCLTIFSVIESGFSAWYLSLLHAAYLDRVINRKTKKFAKKSDFVRFAKAQSNGSLASFNKKNSCKRVVADILAFSNVSCFVSKWHNLWILVLYI